MTTKMWRLRRRSSDEFVVINPKAIDEMYPGNRTGTVIILRSGKVVEVAELLDVLLEHVELEIG